MLSRGSYIGSVYIYTYNRVLYVRMIDDDEEWIISAPLFSSDLRNVLCDCDVLGYRMIRPVLPGACCHTGLVLY